MKVRLLLTLVGLAISTAVPAFAQQKDTVDPRTAQQRDLLGNANAVAEFEALGTKVDEAFNKNDASAVASLFTEDAVLVASDDVYYGRQAIEKRYADTFKQCPITTFSSQNCYELNAIDNAVSLVRKWWSSFQSQTGPKFERGFWSAIYVREGDAWKIRMLTFDVTPTAPPAQTK